MWISGGPGDMNFDDIEERVLYLLEGDYNFIGMSENIHEYHDWDIIEGKYLKALDLPNDH